MNIKALCVLLAFACTSAVAADAPKTSELPLDNFIKHPQFLDVKISPTGEYLAATVLATEDTGALVVLDAKSQKMLGNFKLAGKSLVGNFDWVNPTRLIFSVAKSNGSKTNPTGTGELYGMDYDGKNQALLLSPNKGGGNVKIGFLVDALHDDDKFVLVRILGAGNEEGDYPQLARMNVNTGKLSIVARAPVLNASFLADHEQNARFAWGAGPDLREKLYYRGPDGGNWELIDDEAKSDRETQPLAFSRDGKTVYMQVSEKEGPDSIYAWDVATRERELVARDDDADPFALLRTFDRKQPYAVMFLDGTPRAEPIDEEAPEWALRNALTASFPGSWINITSYTKDGSQVVFEVWSDRNPGEFYLFDRKAKKATYLLSSQQWIEPEQMALMKPIVVTARDGMKIPAFLTLPPGSDGKNLPLILNPHGGPLGPFDAWAYNPEVQLFANRGYAVLQVNYRGSGNYGRAFTRAGYRQWGHKMIDDMTDAIQHVVGQGIVDRDRICIYGASYGGYAAAQAIIREPDLYKCSVGYVGVYDMQMMYVHGDIPDSDTGRNFLDERMGAGKEFLNSISPTRNAEKIKTPMFIVVGNDDIRAHPRHSRAMRDALKAAGKPVEWLEKDYEGHGFYKEENKRELYTKMLAFFEKHIGKGERAADAKASASPPASRP